MDDTPSTPPQNKAILDQFGNRVEPTSRPKSHRLITSSRAALGGLVAAIALVAAVSANLKTISEAILPKSSKADLLISPTGGSSYYTSLDGTDTSPSRDQMFLDGAKLRFSLSHNHKSSDSILVHTLAFAVTEFLPGRNSKYSYRAQAKLPFQGEARVNTFRVEFTNDSMSSAVWIREKKVEKVKLRSANILDLSPRLTFKLNSETDDVESFEGTLLPITAGTYKVVCKIGYTVSGRNSVKELEPVNIYYEE
jgi:hypothetical protein